MSETIFNDPEIMSNFWEINDVGWRNRHKKNKGSTLTDTKLGGKKKVDKQTIGQKGVNLGPLKVAAFSLGWENGTMKSSLGEKNKEPGGKRKAAIASPKQKGGGRAWRKRKKTLLRKGIGRRGQRNKVQLEAKRKPTLQSPKKNCKLEHD